MSGTKAGYIKARQTIIDRHYGGSEEAYLESMRTRGSKGGSVKGGKGGFGAKEPCNCGAYPFTHIKPKCAGKRAGLLSKRGHKYVKTDGTYNYYTKNDTGESVKYSVKG